MILFARMDAATTHAEVIRDMVIAGFGMGLLNPVYTVAVQNVAPRHQMGAATSSTTFFRAIGSTVGVATFGSVFLTRFHRDFASAVPPGTPAAALTPFSNPLMLPQLRSRLEEEFGKLPGGSDLLHKLLAAVPSALIDGLQEIFLASAVIMTCAVVLHFVLRNVPLKAGPQKAPAVTVEA
jgi:MFS family permease